MGAAEAPHSAGTPQHTQMTWHAEQAKPSRRTERHAGRIWRRRRRRRTSSDAAFIRQPTHHSLNVRKLASGWPVTGLVFLTCTYFCTLSDTQIPSDASRTSANPIMSERTSSQCCESGGGEEGGGADGGGGGGGGGSNGKPEPTSPSEPPSESSSTPPSRVMPCMWAVWPAGESALAVISRAVTCVATVFLHLRVICLAPSPSPMPFLHARPSLLLFCAVVAVPNSAASAPAPWACACARLFAGRLVRPRLRRDRVRSAPERREGFR